MSFDTPGVSDFLTGGSSRVAEEEVIVEPSLDLGAEAENVTANLQTLTMADEVSTFLRLKLE